jgi:DNA-binding NarL/FixJ family response regulator
MSLGMEDHLRVAVVADHTRLVVALRQATRRSRLRVLGPYGPDDRLREHGIDVIVVDLDREDGHGLATLIRVCEDQHDVRVVAATAEPDPELGSAVVTAGATGLLLSRELADVQDGLRRAVAGELVLPDAHLTSLVERLRVTPEARVETGSIASLTSRELEVLHSLSRGLSTGEIAALLGISPMTVQSHVKNVLAKLGVHSKVEAVRIAWRCGAIAMPASA